jgi:hypothetical protein
MTGSDKAGIAIEKRRACLLYWMILLHLVAAVAAFLGTIIDHKEMASQTDGARFMAAALS